MDEITLTKTRFRKEQWKQLILDCQNSGMTVLDCCAQQGVTKHTYYYWLRRIREVMEGTSRQTVEAVLLALKSIC